MIEIKIVLDEVNYDDIFAFLKNKYSKYKFPIIVGDKILNRRMKESMIINVLNSYLMRKMLEDMARNNRIHLKVREMEARHY